MFHESLRPVGRTIAHRFFFALRPSARDARRMHVFAGTALGGGWQIQSAARAHVTLAITDDFATVPHDVVKRLLCVGDRVVAGPVELILDRLSVGADWAGLRPSRANARLATLAQALQGGMAHAGVAMRGGFRFNPHLTLGYRDMGPPSTRSIDDFGWRAEEFVLIHSHYGLTRHDLLRRWPLEDRQYALF